MNTERDDPLLAYRHGRTYPKPTSAAPYYMRCTWFQDDIQCLLSAEHGSKPHAYPKLISEPVKTPGPPVPPSDTGAPTDGPV